MATTPAAAASSAQTAQRPESPFRRRARKLLAGVIVVQFVSIVLFIVVLLVGEKSRFTLIALYLPRVPLIVATVGCLLLAPLARWRVKTLAAVQVVLSLVVLFPVMGLSVAGSQAERGRRFKLASYNIHYGHEGKDEIVEELAAMPVDFHVLQASFSGLDDRLKARMPERHVVQSTEWTLISRFPIKSHDPSPPLGEDTAMFVKFVVETPKGLLRIYDVHPYSPRHALFSDDDTMANIESREAQIAAASAAARSDATPFLLVGDTNLPPMSAIGRRHLGMLRDAWSEAGFGFGYTFTSKRPFMRIDRCFGSEGVRFLDVEVGARATSDHRPLYVDFELTTDR